MLHECLKSTINEQRQQLLKSVTVKVWLKWVFISITRSDRQNKTHFCRGLRVFFLSFHFARLACQGGKCYYSNLQITTHQVPREQRKSRNGDRCWELKGLSINSSQKYKFNCVDYKTV